MKAPVIYAFALLLGPLSGFASTQDIKPVFPQQMSAKDLMLLCASSSLTERGRLQRSYCNGFISGIEEGLRVHRLGVSADLPATVCVPPGTSSRTMSDAFVRYASRKGVNLAQPAAALVIQALGDSYSC